MRVFAPKASWVIQPRVKRITATKAKWRDSLVSFHYSGSWAREPITPPNLQWDETCSSLPFLGHYAKLIYSLALADRAPRWRDDVTSPGILKFSIPSLTAWRKLAAPAPLTTR